MGLKNICKYRINETNIAIMYSINLITLFLLVIPYMFSVNATLASYALIPLPILSVCIYFVNNIINKRSTEIQKSLSRLSTFVQEAFSGVRVLKSFVRENDSVSHFAIESNDYKKKSIGLAFVNALFFPLIMSLIGLSVILTVTAYLAYPLYSNSLSLKTVIPVHFFGGSFHTHIGSKSSHRGWVTSASFGYRLARNMPGFHPNILHILGVHVHVLSSHILSIQVVHESTETPQQFLVLNFLRIALKRINEVGGTQLNY